MDIQAGNGDTVLVTSREMTDRSQTLPYWLGGGVVKTTENKINWPWWSGLFASGPVTVPLVQIHYKPVLPGGRGHR